MNKALFFSYKKLFANCLPLLIALNLNTALGQSYSGLAYHKITTKMDSLVKIAKDTNAFINYYSYLQEDSLSEYDIFEAARIFKKRNFSIQRNSALKQLYQRGYNSLYSIDRNLSDSANNFLIDLELENKKIYFRKVPPELFEEISSMLHTDTEIRDLYFANKIPKSVIEKMDSAHFVKIKKLIRRYGFITAKRHGILFNMFYHLIIHTAYYRFSDYNFIKNELMKAYFSGSIHPFNLTYFVDGYEVKNKRPQVYGTFVKRLPLSDWAEVNKRRVAIGLCDLYTWKLLSADTFY